MPVFQYPQYQIQIESNAQYNPLELELYCYKTGHPISKGGLGRAGHFKKITEILWPVGEKAQRGKFQFMWHPWAEKMNEFAHEHPVTHAQYPHLSVSGCGSSGKSMFFSAYALVNWLCDPLNTLVAATSVDIPSARKRVWAFISKLFNSVGCLPGKLVDSQCKIVTMTGSQRSPDDSGLSIIAASRTKEREAVEKIIGLKNSRVFFIADELPELSPAILDACFANLSKNPLFQLVGLGNFKSRYDPFGDLTTPISGYDMLSVDDEDWETKYGWCIRFDGAKSPNVMLRRDEYPKIYGVKDLKNDMDLYGPTSALYWRYCRSFETLAGVEKTVYSESDLLVGKAYDQPTWMGDYTNIAASDPAYTNGGDRFVLYFGRYGMTLDGKWTIAFTHFEVLREDVRKMDVRNRSFQMADQIKAQCEQQGVRPEHFAMDTTSAGIALADVVSEVWSNRIVRVNFSGAATERIASADGKTADQLYVNRVSELWYIGREFVKYGQIKGLHRDTARELKARLFDDVKGADGVRMVVESKKDMKARLLFSPDLGDAAMILVDLVREVFGAVPGDTSVTSNTATWQKQWRDRARQLSELYEPVEV